MSCRKGESEPVWRGRLTYTTSIRKKEEICLFTKLFSIIVTISVLLTSCTIEGSKSSSMSVSGDGSDHLLSEKEAVETLEKLFEAVSRLNGIKMQLAEYEDTSTWTDTFEENGTLYARFQGEVCEALRSSLAGHTDSQEVQSQWENSICGWESVSDIESDILDVFETLEDSSSLQSLVDFLFVEKDGKLYYSARSGSFGSSPYGWDLTTVKVVENTEDRVIFEGQWGFDRVTDAKLTMVKNPSGKWVLTRDYWGENITFGPEDAFFRAVEKGETCKLVFKIQSSKFP